MSQVPAEVVAGRLHTVEHPDCAGQPTAGQVTVAQMILADLRRAGYAVVPAFDLSALWGFLGRIATGRPGWVAERANIWRHSVRGWIPDERHEEDE